jgi:hypothetical protein
MLKSILFLVAFMIASIAHVGMPDERDANFKNHSVPSIHGFLLFDTPSASAQFKIISQYADMDPGTHEVTLMTVPARKIIVITDILVSPSKQFTLHENATLKISLDGYFMRDYHFASGIPFSSGTNIIVRNPSPSQKHIFISGYEVSQ